VRGADERITGAATAGPLVRTIADRGAMFAQIIANNRAGGWRKLKRQS
jgi:hypothetical protein